MEPRAAAAEPRAAAVEPRAAAVELRAAAVELRAAAVEPRAAAVARPEAVVEPRAAAAGPRAAAAEQQDVVEPRSFVAVPAWTSMTRKQVAQTPTPVIHVSFPTPPLPVNWGNAPSAHAIPASRTAIMIRQRAVMPSLPSAPTIAAHARVLVPMPMS